MTEQVKISFIIPAYNIEQYVTKCLVEFTKIKSAECEFLIIDDGSSDDTGKIAKQFCKMDKRFKYFRKSNGGLSSARNYGLLFAKGEWICFWDGDDWISEEVGDYLIDNIDDKSDLVCFGMKSVYTEGETAVWDTHAERKILSKYDIEKIRFGLLNPDSKEYQKYSKKIINFFTACAKLYKREIFTVHLAKFDETVFWSEDLVFNIKAMKYIKQSVVFYTPGYNYRAQLGSITHVYKPDKRKQILHTVQKVFKYLKDENEFSDDIYLLGVKQFLFTLKMDICHLSNPLSYKERKKQFYELKKETEFDVSFRKAKLRGFRLDVRIMAELAKHNCFSIINMLLRIKEKQNNLKTQGQ